MVNKFSHMRFEPSGFTKNPELPIAKSLMDYVFRWLASRFLDQEDQDAVGVVRREPPALELPEPETEPKAPIKVIPNGSGNGNGNGHAGQKLAFVVNADAPACSDCGAITVRSGACYKCLNCGATTGCS